MLKNGSLNDLEAITDSESDEDYSNNRSETLGKRKFESLSESEEQKDDSQTGDRSSENLEDEECTNYKERPEYDSSDNEEDENECDNDDSMVPESSDNFVLYPSNSIQHTKNDHPQTYGSKYLSEYLQYHPDKAKQLSHIIDHVTRRKKLVEIFPEKDLKNKLSSLEITQISIEGFSNSVIQYSYPPNPILQLFLDVFVSLPVNASTVRLAIFYVYNHLIQTFTNDKIWKYPVSFHQVGLDTFCIPAIIHTNKIKCNNIIHICNCINIWRQRCVYPKDVCEKLEQISTNTSIIKTGPTVQNYFNINDELGYLNILYYIFKMPLVDEAYEKAVLNCDVERLTNCDKVKDKEYLEKMIKLNKEHEFNQAGRLSGQELIILQSACLDLGALIKENDQNFEILKKKLINSMLY